MMRSGSIGKLGAVVACGVALSLSGAAQAKVVNINLGTIDTKVDISSSYAYKSGQTVDFLFTVDKPFNFDFSYSAMLSGVPFPLTDNTSGGPGSYKVVFGPYPAAGTIDYSLSTAAPEPATWALMALGFAGLGFAGYRKTKKSELGLAVA